MCSSDLVAFARAREGAVQLDARTLGCAAHEVPREQSKTAGPGRVAGAGAHHDGANDV